MKIKAFLVKLQIMIINWHGGGCYKISTSSADIIIDPYSSNGVGNRLKGDLVLKTQSFLPLDINSVGKDEIIMAGEYEILGVKIRGTQVASASPTNYIQTVYKIVVDDIELGFLGDISVELDEKTLDDLGEIDILFVPSKNIASKLIKSVDPHIAIPGWGDPEKVMTDTGQRPEVLEKLVIKKKELQAQEGFRLVVLQS